MNINVNQDEVREIFAQAIRDEGIKACKEAMQEGDIRAMIRQAFNKGYINKSLMEKAIEDNLKSATTSAIWNLFEEPEIKTHLQELVKAEIESDEFKALIKQAVHNSVWSSSIKVNPQGVKQ